MPKAAQNQAPSGSPFPDPTGFPIKEARKLVLDLARANPRIYWTDFLISATVGWGALALSVVTPAFSILQIVAIVVAALALYRAVIFTHELSHLPRTQFRAFRWVWNLLAGFPMMAPSYTYAGVHGEHHQRSHYGTHGDGEYLPFGAKSPIHMMGFLAVSFVAPLAMAFRFVVLTPLGWVVPRFADLLWTYASSLVIDASYRRPPPGASLRENWRLQEALACLYGLLAIGLVLTGVMTSKVLLMWYIISALAFLANALRTLAAHAYRHDRAEPMSQAEEFLDSVNVPGNRWITPLWAPVGLRFHATHHLFPGLPYHNLEEAHRRLMANLPDTTHYEMASRKSLWDALTRIWAESRAASRAGHSKAAAVPAE